MIDCLIGDVTFAELADLLNFLGLLATKYKVSVVLRLSPVLDRLKPVLFDRLDVNFDDIGHPAVTGFQSSFLLSQVAHYWYR